MLAPHDRAGLFEALRPPSGFMLDHAVGTSFTLDLEALLTAPIAFALYAASDLDAADGLEPVGLLEAVRRHAERITLFCQSGHIAVPAAHRTVFAWLEDVVVPVEPVRRGYLFHPKVWVVRFVSADGDRAVLRVLCATRNLTFDTSWDSLLRVETDPYPVETGPAAEQPNLAPLGDLVRALPRMAVDPVSSPSIADAIERVAADLDRAHALPPEPFADLAFTVHGLAGSVPLPVPADADGVAIVSPFVDPRFLRDVEEVAPIRLLVSRDATLAGLGEAVADVGRSAVLNPAAEVDASSDGRIGAAPLHGGLHAKLFVSDGPSHSTVVTGSANATRAAFGGNVEVTATMTGPIDQVGIDALLDPGSKGAAGFGAVLVDFTPREDPVDTAADELIRVVDAVRRRLSVSALSASVTADGADFRMVLSGEVDVDGGDLLDRLDVSVRPVTLAPAAAVAVPAGAAIDATFSVSLEGITAFFVLEVMGERAGLTHSTATLVKATLEGVPDDRRRKLLAAMLRDPERLLRYLVLLLSDGPEGMDGDGDGSGMAWLRRLGGRGWDDVPLVELLVRAVERDPARLDHIDGLVTDLGDQRGEVLPSGFDDLWAAVWEIRQEAGR
ncbi:hypothetical protein HC251_24135 [Iamia sp. SCSIO 61187]|uniref:phospholipase D family protein n=1 Tax=Iamia sp. SCSIO 61187 TaxID=2722752 RepID=UPI001C6366B0|nr:phospholipase D family protein [Iamia sp. SCSIO 61187]QYG95212.1 hypothetical protein HC251_24135 [Iamia sp. SCSIO 61187]